MLTHTATPLNGNKNYIYNTHTHKTDCSEVPQSCVYDENCAKTSIQFMYPIDISVTPPPPPFWKRCCIWLQKSWKALFRSQQVCRG